MTAPLRIRSLTAIALAFALAACGEEEKETAAVEVETTVESTVQETVQAVAETAEEVTGTVEETVETAGAAATPALALADVPAAGGPLMADAVLGNAEASVTVIEYASLTCGHCASFHTGTYPAFKEKYVDTGKVQMIYRDFPLDQRALAASIVARCDGSPAKYHAFVDLFLRQQSKWARAEDIITELKRMARLGGLSDEQVDGCFADDALGQYVLDTAREGQEEFGINSTPSFIINGTLHSGSMNIEQISAIIDPLL